MSRKMSAVSLALVFGCMLFGIQNVHADADAVYGNTQYTDGDTAATPVGTVALGKNPSNLVKPLSLDGSGNLNTTISGTVTVGSHAVTNAGTFVVQENGAALTSLQLLDDSVYTDGTGTVSKGIEIFGQDGTNPQAVKTDASGELQIDVLTMPTVTVTDGAGALNVIVDSGSMAVTNAGTFVVQENGAALTALQLIDDGIYTDDTSTHSTGTSKGYGMMAAATPTDAAVNANDIGMLAMTLNRELLVQVNTALPAGTNAIGKLSANSGVDIGDVDVLTVGTNTPGTGQFNLGKSEDLASASGDVGVLSLSKRLDTPVANALVNADADYLPLITDNLGKLWNADNQTEDVAAGTGERGSFSLGVANEAQSSLAADGDYVANAKDVKGNSLTVGNLAHDAVDAGFPLKVGGQARTTNPTAVADADRVNAIFDKLGKQITVSAIRDLKAVQKTTITSSTSETTIVTQIASTFCDLYGLIIANTSASACNVTIKDSTAGTTRAILAVPAGETRGFMLDPGSAIPQATVNTNWTATCSASVASIEITALYVKNT